MPVLRNFYYEMRERSARANEARRRGTSRLKRVLYPSSSSDSLQLRLLNGGAQQSNKSPEEKEKGVKGKKDERDHQCQKGIHGAKAKAKAKSGQVRNNGQDQQRDEDVNSTDGGALLPRIGIPEEEHDLLSPIDSHSSLPDADRGHGERSNIVMQESESQYGDIESNLDFVDCDNANNSGVAVDEEAPVLLRDDHDKIPAVHKGFRHSKTDLFAEGGEIYVDPIDYDSDVLRQAIHDTYVRSRKLSSDVEKENFNPGSGGSRRSSGVQDVHAQEANTDLTEEETYDHFERTPMRRPLSTLIRPMLSLPIRGGRPSNDNVDSQNTTIGRESQKNFNQ